MRLSIDVDRCTGHGRCYSLVPELFTDDERGYGQVTQPDVPAELLDRARTAVANCPEGAIHLDER